MMKTECLKQFFGRKSDFFRSFIEISARPQVRLDDRFKQQAALLEEFYQVAYGDIVSELAHRTRGVENDRLNSEDLFVLFSYYSLVVQSLLEALCTKLGLEVTHYPLLSHGHDNNCRTSPEVVPHSWVSAVEDPHMSGLTGRVIDKCKVTADYLSEGQNTHYDLLKPLFENIFPRRLRHLLGEYYTPLYLAEAIFATLQDENLSDSRILDPGCGSGIFLGVAIRHKMAELERMDVDSHHIIERITNTVVGIDINPVAVLSARLNYVLNLVDLIRKSGSSLVNIPVYLADSIGVSDVNQNLDSECLLEPLLGNIDILVGNPPWVSWGHLTVAVRTRWKERYVDAYSLLKYSGKEARLGHSNDDISVPFIWVAMDKYLKRGGLAGFILKRTLLQGPAGKLFRSLEICRQDNTARSMRITRIQDWNAVRPFGNGAGSETMIVTIQLDKKWSFPIEFMVWETESGERPLSTMGFALAKRFLKKRESKLVPLGERDSLWAEQGATPLALGHCRHKVRHGAKDDLKVVYELAPEAVLQLEPDLIFPYLRSRDIIRWGFLSYSYRLIPQRKYGEDNETLLRSRHPHTYAYLVRNRDALIKRRSIWLKNGPFYNVFAVGNYTWAKFKVAWCRLGFRPEFSVISTVKDPLLGVRPLIPGDHFMFIPTDNEYEAHMLCALLNSSPYRTALESISHKSKSALSSKVISKLYLPLYHEIAHLRELAHLSIKAHGIVRNTLEFSMAKSRKVYTEPNELGDIQSEIDSIAQLVLDGKSRQNLSQSNVQTTLY